MYEELTLSELESKQECLYNKWKDLKKDTTTALLDFLDKINEGAPLPVFRRATRIVDINKYDSWKFRDNGNYKWSLNFEVEFPDPDDPNKSDFGSDFYLYITNLDLRVNHGTCGTWDKTDKGQYSRLLLLVKIFEHQDELIQLMDQVIDMDLYKELSDISDEVGRRHEKIRLEEEAKRDQEFLEQATPGKYFATLGYTWVYPDNSNEAVSKKYIFYGFEKILKVTDKNFITEEKGYPGVSRRKNKQVCLLHLRRHNMFIIDDITLEPTEEQIQLANLK